MTRKHSDKPHRTPHPDQPHAMGAAKDKSTVPGSAPEEEAESDVPNYDSCVDDLNLLLAASINEPDPNLDSNTPGSTAPSSSRTDDGIKRSASERAREPRTSEVFKTVGPLVVDAPGTKSGLHIKSTTLATPDHTAATSPQDQWQRDVDASIETEDESHGLPVPWTHLLLLSYSSALTLAMIWMVWNGWLRRPPVPESSDPSLPAAESTTKAPETKPAIAVPPIPTENIAKLGQAIQVGELEVTPLSVMLMPLTLVRTFEPSTERHESGSSLVLRLRLTNTSKNHTLTPLEPGFLRDPNSPLDRCYIETEKQTTISLFPLALDSEWSIRGEEFPTLKPGESRETTIVSEAGAADKLSSEMTWRVRVRIGSYRTDLVGARFSKDEVTTSSNADDCGGRDGR